MLAIRVHFVMWSIFMINTDVDAQSFIQSQDQSNLIHTFSQVSFNGGGVAFVDIDNDLDDDVYLVGGLEKDRLFLNMGNGEFEEITEGSGIEISEEYYTTGAIYGDIDNDGDEDIFVSTIFKVGTPDEFAKNLLFKNNGDLTFTEVWTESLFRDKSMALGATMLDYDLDGDLDIYCINYVEEIRFTYDDNGDINGFAHDCFRNYMYRNEGNDLFREVGEILGLDDRGCALAVVATDYDGDGDQDILLGNDFGPFIEPNKLYRNDFNTIGRFTEVSASLGADQQMFSMGIAVGDYDNDLDLDYYVSNLGKNVFLEQQSEGFDERAADLGVENEFSEEGADSPLAVSWGNLFVDIDNDMDLDLFVANGYVPAPSFVDNSRLDPDRLFINNGDRTFTEVDSSYGINNLLASRGCAYADIDMDGKMDIFSIVYDKPGFGLEPESCLFQNNISNDNNWVKLKLKGQRTHRNAYGSRIYLYAGEDVLMAEHTGASSFCSQHSSFIHFGLASHQIIDSIQVVWTGGSRSQTHYKLEVNRLHVITEGIVTSTEGHRAVEIKVFPNPSHDIFRIASESELKSYEIYDAQGRLVRRASDRIIDLSNEEAGVYIAKIMTGKAYRVIKLVRI